MGPSLPAITDAEWDVMDILWDRAPRTAQEVHGALERRRDWSLGTVKTLLTRLLRKGALTYEAEGKRYLYRPAVSRRACVKEAGKELLRRAGRGAESPLLLYFLRESKLDPAEIQALREMLDRLERDSEAKDDTEGGA